MKNLSINTLYIYISIIFSFSFFSSSAIGYQNITIKDTVLRASTGSLILPEFEFLNVLGGTLKSAEMNGKIIVIRFWASW